MYDEDRILTSHKKTPLKGGRVDYFFWPRAFGQRPRQEARPVGKVRPLGPQTRMRIPGTCQAWCWAPPSGLQSLGCDGRQDVDTSAGSQSGQAALGPPPRRPPPRPKPGTAAPPCGEDGTPCGGPAAKGRHGYKPSSPQGLFGAPGSRQTSTPLGPYAGR